MNTFAYSLSAIIKQLTLCWLYSTWGPTNLLAGGLRCYNASHQIHQHYSTWGHREGWVGASGGVIKSDWERLWHTNVSSDISHIHTSGTITVTCQCTHIDTHWRRAGLCTVYCCHQVLNSDSRIDLFLDNICIGMSYILVMAHLFHLFSCSELLTVCGLKAFKFPTLQTEPKCRHAHLNWPPGHLCCKQYM